MAHRLKVTLIESRPPIWRRFEVPADITLAQLHRVLQIVMGWTNSHLHEFEKNRIAYGVSDPEFGVRRVSETTTRLGDLLIKPGDYLDYLYDFGDSWRHRVVLEALTAPVPGDDARRARVIAARRACPPEDIGGMWGYEHFLEVMADPAHADHAQMREWSGGGFDPDAYDIDAANLRLARLRLPPPPAARARRGAASPKPPQDAVDAMIAKFMGDASQDDPRFLKRIEAKLVDPSAILADREVRFLADRIRRSLGVFGTLPGVAPTMTEDMIRWQAVRSMCERARAERSLSTQDAAKALKIPHYRIRAVEDGPGPSFTLEHAARYFRFLRIETWLGRWVRANPELARRAGLA